MLYDYITMYGKQDIKFAFYIMILWLRILV